MITKILKQLADNGITNKLEQAHFLAQAAHESFYFMQLGERDKFTFARAIATWPTRAKIILDKQEELEALDAHLCPQPWLFNTVYGSRMGNEANGTDDDDGYNFRGAGMLQLTGAGMYKDFVKWLNNSKVNLTNVRKYCLTEDGAIKSAIWFWKSKGCGVPALADDIEAVTRKVNGGTHGIKERIALLVKYKRFLEI